MQALSRTRWLAIVTSLALITALSLEGFSNVKASRKKRQHARAGAPVLWRDPGNIRSRDLFYGAGSKALAPVPPFRFLKEVKDGKSPKFDVEDARGVTWRVKLGPEAQAETVATRLVWAVGYNAEESYYLDRAHIDGLRRLSRGQKYVEGALVRGARFEPRRDNVERGKRWDWAKNPFKGTRELNGLKTMMVLLNNWDLRKNNTILHVKDPSTNRVEAQYTVTDLGAVLGAAGAIGGRHRSKNNVQDFQRSFFVRKVDDGMVQFDYDIRPKNWVSSRSFTRLTFLDKGELTRQCTRCLWSMPCGSARNSRSYRMSNCGTALERPAIIDLLLNPIYAYSAAA